VGVVALLNRRDLYFKWYLYAPRCLPPGCGSACKNCELTVNASASTCSTSTCTDVSLDLCLEFCAGTRNHDNFGSCSQQLSCDQACYIRYDGASPDECQDEFQRPGNTGCDMELRGRTYLMCTGCLGGGDLVQECKAACQFKPTCKACPAVNVPCLVGCQDCTVSRQTCGACPVSTCHDGKGDVVCSTDSAAPQGQSICSTIGLTPHYSSARTYVYDLRTSPFTTTGICLGRSIQHARVCCGERR
jgi:hypothetical protein